MEKTHSQITAKPQLPRVIAISSGKGGVGKSSICVNLGISLAKTGAHVCLLDADTGLANANILLGLSPEFNLEHVLYGSKAIEEVMLDGPFGLKIIPGANGISESVNLHPRQQMRLTRELARVEGEYDYILIDTAAGIAPTTLDFISASHCALIVITPEPTSLTDAFSLIKLLKRRHSDVQFQIVVNMSGSSGQAKEVYHRFSNAVEKYVGVHCHYLGFILRDESMRAAVVLQNPVTMFPDTDPSCRSFKTLADKLVVAIADVPVEPAFSEYWRRQFSGQNSEYNNGNQAVVALKQPVAEVNSSAENDSLEALRSGILQLIEQSPVSASSLEALLQDCIDAFMDQYQHVPVDVLKLVDFIVASPERDDQLARDIAERVRPWASLNIGWIDPGLSLRDMAENVSGNDNLPVPTLMPEVQFNIINEQGDISPSGELAKNQLDGVGSIHSGRSTSGVYNQEKFGSQQQLLDKLRSPAGSDKSLLELLASL